MEDKKPDSSKEKNKQKSKSDVKKNAVQSSARWISKALDSRMDDDIGMFSEQELRTIGILFKMGVCLNVWDPNFRAALEYMSKDADEYAKNLSKKEANWAVFDYVLETAEYVTSEFGDEDGGKTMQTAKSFIRRKIKSVTPAQIRLWENAKGSLENQIGDAFEEISPTFDHYLGQGNQLSLKCSECYGVSGGICNQEPGTDCSLGKKITGELSDLHNPTSLNFIKTVWNQMMISRALRGAKPVAEKFNRKVIS